MNEHTKGLNVPDEHAGTVLLECEQLTTKDQDLPEPSIV